MFTSPFGGRSNGPPSPGSVHACEDSSVLFALNRWKSALRGRCGCFCVSRCDPLKDLFYVCKTKTETETSSSGSLPRLGGDWPSERTIALLSLDEDPFAAADPPFDTRGVWDGSGGGALVGVAGGPTACPRVLRPPPAPSTPRSAWGWGRAGAARGGGGGVLGTCVGE